MSGAPVYRYHLKGPVCRSHTAHNKQGEKRIQAFWYPNISSQGWRAESYTKSKWAPVLSGEPYGTVLGSLLYINDIMDATDSEVRLFADDCVCYRQIHGMEDTVKLKSDIDRLDK